MCKNIHALERTGENNGHILRIVCYGTNRELVSNDGVYLPLLDASNRFNHLTRNVFFLLHLQATCFFLIFVLKNQHF